MTVTVSTCNICKAEVGKKNILSQEKFFYDKNEVYNNGNISDKQKT